MSIMSYDPICGQCVLAHLACMTCCVSYCFCMQHQFSVCFCCVYTAEAILLCAPEAYKRFQSGIYICCFSTSLSTLKIERGTTAVNL